MNPRPLAVGDVIHGFAYGAFGRDHYQCVRIEAVGPDWIVTRDADGEGSGFTGGRRSLELCIKARDEPCPLADLDAWGIDAQCPFQQEPPLTAGY